MGMHVCIPVQYVPSHVIAHVFCPWVLADIETCDQWRVIVLLMMPTIVVLLTCMGVRDCGCHILAVKN